jgi:hypothetical protein
MIREQFTRTTQDFFARAAGRLDIASRPPQQPKSVLQGQQELSRQSPQPDRLVAVRAAASPLFEAAGSLLDALSALARRQGQLDAARADKLHRQLVSEVASFQSICHDARLRYEVIPATADARWTACSIAFTTRSAPPAGMARPICLFTGNRSNARPRHQEDMPHPTTPRR